MSFETDLSRQFGGNANMDVVGWLSSWTASEGGSRGGSRGWNPLNVAGVPGYPTWQSSDGANINIFPTEQVAVAQTAQRIASGYPGITKLLSDSSVDASHVRAALPDLCKWGSKTFAGNQAGDPNYCKTGHIGSGGQATEGAGAADWTSFDLGDAWNALTSPLDVLKEAFRFVLWLLQPKHWVQMLEIVFGAVFVAVGIYLLAKAGSGGRSSAGKAAAATAAVAAPIAKPVVRRVSIADRTG